MRFPLAVRKWSSRFLAPFPVRIVTGPNEGFRWSLAASGRHWAGTFEKDRVDAILSLLRSGDCFWDIGAHHGYVSLAASRLVGASGRVYSFEPSRYNYAYLKRHIRWNGCQNVVPLNLGVAAAPGDVQFGGRGTSQTFRMGRGDEVVQVTSLEALSRGEIAAPDVVKIDVEGAEVEILKLGAEFLPAKVVAFVSVHSEENCRDVVASMQAVGFTVFFSPDLRAALDRAVWGEADPDLVAVGTEGGDRLVAVRRLAGFTPVAG